MPLSIFFGLVICNLIWSFHPILGKWLLEDFNPIQVAWLRYASALLGYLVFIGFLRFTQRGQHLTWRSFFLIPKKSHDRWILSTLGILAYCFSPLLQTSGLSVTLATENAIIVALEPLLSAFLAWLVLKERMSKDQVVAFLLALLGFTFLSGLTQQSLRVEGSAHLLGDLLILVSLLGEASFSVLGRSLVSRFAPSAIFGTSLVVGVLALTLATFLLHSFGWVDFYSGLTHFTWKSFFALLWIGPVGTAGGYLFTLYALADISVVSMALFLFLQPLAGGIWAYLFLGDRLSPVQHFGGSLILLAIFIPSWTSIRRRIKNTLVIQKTT